MIAQTKPFDQQADLSVVTLYPQVLRALQLWHETSTENPFAQLLLYQAAMEERGRGERKIINHILYTALESLETLNTEFALLLRKRFLDKMTGEAVANRLALSSAAFSRKQRQAVDALTQILLTQELQLHKEFQSSFEARLEPPSYQQLFGVEPSIQLLTEQLATAKAPWILALEGMGGVGKTSLADAFMRHAIAQNSFAGFGWISARRQRLHPSGMLQVLDKPALTTESFVEQLCAQLLTIPLPQPFALLTALPLLTAKLKETPHLIAVDNLETVADLNELLPLLQRLVNPTKFLITTRERIYVETTTYSYQIPLLNEADALQLLRHEAKQRNLPALAHAINEQLYAIVETVGGNPLALRLIVGQTAIHDLPTIVDNLQQARGQTIEHLYTYIYHYAWETLNDLARRVLIAMPLIPEHGGSAQQIATYSKLSTTEVGDALTNLVARNLVNRHGTWAESHFTIHSLTRTFLLKQVTKWM